MTVESSISIVSVALVFILAVSPPGLRAATAAVPEAMNRVIGVGHATLRGSLRRVTLR